MTQVRDERQLGTGTGLEPPVDPTAAGRTSTRERVRARELRAVAEAMTALSASQRLPQPAAALGTAARSARLRRGHPLHRVAVAYARAGCPSAAVAELVMHPAGRSAPLLGTLSDCLRSRAADRCKDLLDLASNLLAEESRVASRAAAVRTEVRLSATLLCAVPLLALAALAVPGRALADPGASVAGAALAALLFVVGALWVRALVRSVAQGAGGVTVPSTAQLHVALDQLALHLHTGRSLTSLVAAAEQAGVAGSVVLEALEAQGAIRGHGAAQPGEQAATLEGRLRQRAEQLRQAQLLGWAQVARSFPRRLAAPFVGCLLPSAVLLALAL